MFKVNKRRSATDAIFANSLTLSRLNRRSVFLQENVRIMYLDSIGYYAVRQAYNCKDLLARPPASAATADGGTPLKSRCRPFQAQRVRHWAFSQEPAWCSRPFPVFWLAPCLGNEVTLEPRRTVKRNGRSPERMVDPSMVVRNISEAKAELSALIEAVQNGSEVIIAKAGKPVARLVAFRGPARPRTPGSMAGEIWIATDFDILPDDIAEAFGMKEPRR